MQRAHFYYVRYALLASLARLDSLCLLRCDPIVVLTAPIHDLYNSFLSLAIICRRANMSDTKNLAIFSGERKDWQTWKKQRGGFKLIHDDDFDGYEGIPDPSKRERVAPSSDAR